MKKNLVSARVFCGLEGYLKQRGQDGALLLRQWGGEPDSAIGRNSFVDLGEVVALFEMLARELRDDAFGLQFAEACPRTSVGLRHFAAANCATLRDALATRALFDDLMARGYDPSYREEGNGRFSWSRTAAGPHRQFMDFIVGQLVIHTRIMLDQPGWMPLAVELPHSKPRTMQVVRRVLGNRVRFDAKKAAVHFSASNLGMRLPRSDPFLHRAIVDALGTLKFDPTHDGSIVDQAHTLMTKEGRFHPATERAVAQALRISVRTLQRELADAGTTYRELADCARRSTALQLLHDTECR